MKLNIGQFYEILSYNLNAHVYLKTVSPVYMKTSLHCCKHELPHPFFAHMQTVVSAKVFYALPLTLWINVQCITIKLVLYILNSICQVTIIFLEMNCSVFLKKDSYCSV